jgi:hypothetical protein
VPEFANGAPMNLPAPPPVPGQAEAARARQEAHARCDPSDHLHCPRCGGRLEAFAWCPPCGQVVDFRMMAAPSPDMRALLRARAEVEHRAGTGQAISFVEACDRVSIPPQSRMAVARFLSGVEGLEKFTHLTREQAWEVLNRMDQVREWREARNGKESSDD